MGTAIAPVLPAKQRGGVAAVYQAPKEGACQGRASRPHAWLRLWS